MNTVTINLEDRAVDWGFDERSNDLIEFLPGATPPILIAKVPSGSHWTSLGAPHAYSKTGYRVATLELDSLKLSPSGYLVFKCNIIASFDQRPDTSDTDRMWAVMEKLKAKHVEALRQTVTEALSGPEHANAVITRESSNE